MANFESDLIHLRCENQQLREEIVQLTGDKEFVWSLWKRLQVANPDLTQAVGLIMAREKTKTEEKDAKILGLLQAKDSRIEELEKVVAHKDHELSDAIQQKADLLESVKQLEYDLVRISDRNVHLEERCQRRDDSSNNLEEKYRRVVEHYECEKLELGDRVSLLQTQLTQRREEILDLRAQLIESQAALTAAQREANAADQQLEALRQELTQYKSCAVEQKESAGTLEQALEEVRAQADEWRRRAQQLECVVQSNSVDVNCHTGGKLLASSVLAVDETPVVDYEYRAEALQRVVDQLKQKVRALQAGARHTSDTRKRIRSSSAPAPSQLQERVYGLKKKLLSAEKLVRLKEEDRLHLICELNRKGALLRKVQESNRHLKKRLGELDSELHQCCAFSAAAPKSVDRLNSDETALLNDLRGALSKVELRCRQLEDEVHLKTASAAEEASIAYELRQQLSAQKSDETCNVRLIMQLRSDLERAAEELANNEEMMRAWNKERGGLRAELACAAQEVGQKRRLVADLTRQVATLRAQCDSVPEDDVDEEEELTPKQRVATRCTQHGSTIEDEEEELEPVRDSDRTDVSLGTGIVKKATATAHRSGWAVAAVGPPGSRLPLSTRLRRRVAALQQQLRATKRSHIMAQEELRKSHLRCQTLDKSLATAHQRNRSLHELCGRLSGDLEDIQIHVKSDDTAAAEAASPRSCAAQSTFDDAEIRALESRARVAGQELVRQAAQLRELRSELDTKEQICLEQKSRITQLERDLTQKRSVIDSMKQRLAQSAAATSANKEALDAGEQRLRDAQALAERHRVAVDSLRVRLGALTKEKQRWLSEATEAEKTVEEQRRAVLEAQEVRRQALRQSALAEERATRQCAEASQHAQTALLEARDQLQKAHVRLMQCERLVSLLSRVVCAKTEQARMLVAQLLDAASRRRRHRHHRRQNEVEEDEASLQAARDRAAHLLNLSTSDVDEMLNPSSDDALNISSIFASADNEDKMRDRNFMKKCCKVLLSNCNFAERLADCFAEKLDEILHLIKRLEA